MNESKLADQKTSRKPRVTIKALARVFIGVLLLWLGGVIGVRFATTGELPFNLHKLPFVRSSITVGVPSQAKRLIGQDNPRSGEVDFNPFWEVWALLEQEYLEPEKLDAEKMRSEEHTS